MEEPRPRYHWWHSAEHPVWWRHHRFHLTFPERGTGGPYGPRDLGFSGEWILFPGKGKGHGLGWQVKWGTNASESTPDLAVFAGPIGALFLGFEHVLPWGWLERHRPDGSVDYDTRVFALRWHDDRLWWDCWSRSGHWSSRDPKWMQGSWSWKRALFGNQDRDMVTDDEGVTVVPMPEANYPAVWKRERSVFTYPKPLGRLRDRLLGPLTVVTVTIEPGAPVPIPGKGENSWDLDDDAIHSMTTRGASVEDAVAALVASALKTRARHGGQRMNVPKVS